jgi:hypothetical protein
MPSDMPYFKKTIEAGEKPTTKGVGRDQKWQNEHGVRYGNARKLVSGLKKKIRKKLRAVEKQTVFCNLCGGNHDDCITW